MYCDICIIAPDEGLSRLLLSECRDLGHVASLSDGTTPPRAPFYIIDADFYTDLPDEGNIIRYARTAVEATEEKDGRIVTTLSRPFSLSRLRRLLLGGEAVDTLTLLPAHTAVRLSARAGARVISLSPTEYACLATLYKANGAPVSREELYAAVWGEGPVKNELINLYLHYLRKKLEVDGRRYIVSVRGRGYLLKREDDAL